MEINGPGATTVAILGQRYAHKEIAGSPIPTSTSPDAARAPNNIDHAISRCQTIEARLLTHINATRIIADAMTGPVPEDAEKQPSPPQNLQAHLSEIELLVTRLEQQLSRFF